ncbi:MAG TPA: SulP family inorganic anion transporter, partial [Anaerolineae bacterium]|nr:SulP family inorganic anion transporter [Anaerolineae bacterium]
MQLNREKLGQLLKRYVPITEWLPAYPRNSLRRDLISGITVWGVMVPVAMAYAEMAGLPPEAGLYTAFAALLGYAVFGTSRQLKVTTSSTMAVMSAAVVVAMRPGDLATYAALTAALALIVGVILLVAGVARLGFISDFLSKSVVTGFVFGLALVIAIGQLPKLLGLPSGEGDFFEQLYQVITNASEINPYTAVVGISALV